MGFLTICNLCRQIAIRHDVELVSAQRPDPRQDHGILDMLLRDHLLKAGKQVGAKLEAQDDDSLQVPADGEHVGHVEAVRLVVNRRISGPVLTSRRVSCAGSARQQTNIG